jgi:endogenous inhibitor of DNA gyrase (YacG/DUF329 family)
MTEKDVRIIRCPACGGPSRYAADNRHRPFCSERCRNLDLGAWASESYRVPTPPGDPGDDDTLGGDPPVGSTTPH